MTGSPVFKFNSHLTKKQKIQRKLNFVRDVPRNQLRLHIDNLRDSDKNSDSQDEKEAPKPTRSFSSLSSFVFENKKGVKRKLDFDGDDVSEGVSSFRFSNQNISLNGLHSRNSSLCDVKSVTVSPGKNPGRRSSCTRSSIASTCRRRLFPDGERETKRAKLESPVLCPRPRNKEVKLSLKKRFPGVPNSDAARSGLLLNLAFSKYNMLNANQEENVSVDFVGQKSAKSSTKKELLQYSSIKKDSSSFHFSPVFKAIKKVKRKLDLEENEANVSTEPSETLDAKQPSLAAQSDAIQESYKKSGGIPPEISKETESGARAVASSDKSATKSKAAFWNSRLRPSLRNEIFNLSKPNQENPTRPKADSCQMQKRFSHSSNILVQRNLGCAKVRSKCDRIIVNKSSLEDRSLSRTDRDTSSKDTESAASRSAKRWFNDSFYKGKRSDLRKSLFHRRHEAFVDSHIQRFLNDCAQAAESSETSGQSECEADRKLTYDDDPGSRIEDVESPVRTKAKAAPGIEEVSTTDTEVGTATCSQGTSPVIQLETRPGRSTSICQNMFESPKEPVDDFIIEDSTSQEINKHCVEEIEVFIDDAESDDGFIGFTSEECQIADETVCELKNFTDFNTTDDNNVFQASIEEESISGCSRKSNPTDRGLQVEDVSSSESVSEELHFTEPTEGSSTPSKEMLELNHDETFDSAKKRKRKKCYSDDLVSRLDRLVCCEKSDLRMFEYEMSKRTKDEKDDRSKPAVFRVGKMWKEFSRLILLCTLAHQDPPDKLYEVDKIKNFGVGIENSVTLIMDPATCPKTLTCSSVLRVHPPWNILSLEKYDRVVILRPKVEVISKDDESPVSRNLTLPNVLNERQFCSCPEACNCALPEGYQTVIQPLLYSSSLLSNFKSCRRKTYDEKYFKCINGVSDAVLKHKLFPSEHLFLDLRVLYVQRYFVCNECVLWHYLCIDNGGDVCCLVVEDEIRTKIPIVGKNEFLRFFGILPWKVIPAKSVPSFIDHIEYHDVTEVEDRLGSTSLYVFVLSKKCAKIERVG